jgi:PPOX class probable F420-dependent enzyme
MSLSELEKYPEFFKTKALAHLATLMPDGSPQVTPVWVDCDGEHVVFNSALGRVKDKNVRRDPRVSLSILDPNDDYRYLEIRGRVVEITEEGADENINMLSRKYTGNSVYGHRKPGEVRILYKVQPDRVFLKQGVGKLTRVV